MALRTRARRARGGTKRPQPPPTRAVEMVFTCILAAGLAVLPLVGGKLATPLGLAAGAGLLLIFGCGIVVVLKRGHIPFRGQWLDAAMLAWLGIVLLSCLWSVNLHRSLLGLSQVICYVGVFFLARWLANRQEARRLLLAGIAAGAFISAAVGLESYAVNVVLLKDPQWRIFGPFINPNAFAGYLLVAIPALVILGVSERSVVLRGCCWALLLVAAGALLLTGSKGGILAAFVAVGILGWRLIAQAEASRRQRRLLLLSAAAAALIVIVAALAVPPIRERIASIGAESHSATFRAYTWLGALKMASARPILGWGVGSFDSVFAGFSVAGYTRAAHNDYLQTAAETGFLGMGAYLLILGGFLRNARRKPADTGADGAVSLACWMAALAFCLHTLVDSDLPVLATGATLFLLIGLGSTGSLSGPPDREATARPFGTPTLASLLVVIILLSSYAAASAYAESQRQAGRSALRKGAVSLALSYLRQATRFSPLSGEAHRDLARGLEVKHLRSGRKEDLKRAKEEVMRAAGLDRMRPVNWLVLARVEEQLGQHEAAQRHYEQASRLAPKAAHTWLELAEFHFRRAASSERPESGERSEAEALAALQRIQQIEESPAGKVKAIPDLVDLTFSRARLYMARRALEQGKPAEGLAAADWVLAEIEAYRASKSVEALRVVGEERYRGEERLEAMAFLLRAEVKETLGDNEEAKRDKEAAWAAWDGAAAAFRSFLEGGVLP